MYRLMKILQQSIHILGSDGVNPFIDVCKEEKKGTFHSC